MVGRWQRWLIILIIMHKKSFATFKFNDKKYD